MAVKVGLLNIFSIQHNETQVGDYMQRHHSILGRSSTESTQCCVACAVNQGQGQIKTKLAWILQLEYSYSSSHFQGTCKAKLKHMNKPATESKSRANTKIHETISWKDWYRPANQMFSPYPCPNLKDTLRANFQLAPDLLVQPHQPLPPQQETNPFWLLTQLLPFKHSITMSQTAQSLHPS